MARTERIKVKYESVLLDGLRESNMAGEIVEYGEDEPYKIRVRRATVTEVHDGRGRNWAAGTSVDEILMELTLEEAAGLAQSLINDITYAAVVAERRVLIPEPVSDSSDTGQV